MAKIVLPGEPLRDGPTALRPWRDSDVSALVAACQDPEIARWTRVPENYGEADARVYLLQRYGAIHAGTLAPFAIVAASEYNLLLGSISLMRLEWEHARGEVGYWLAAQARGRGHITRAVRLICRWGFDSLALERIDLLAATGNTASQRVAERAGFTREGVLRSYMRGRDGRQDMVAFGLLAAEAGAADQRGAVGELADGGHSHLKRPVSFRGRASGADGRAK
jgi:ribosomal-protein-alanine N-acetyltransferase